jgi:hypothetical protein
MGLQKYKLYSLKDKFREQEERDLATLKKIVKTKKVEVKTKTKKKDEKEK